jgi:hypothetical protein
LPAVQKITALFSGRRRFFAEIEFRKFRKIGCISNARKRPRALHPKLEPESRYGLNLLGRKKPDSTSCFTKGAVPWQFISSKEKE